LIHFCWQAVVIIALYLIADWALRNARSGTRYLVSLTTLLAMFLVFACTLGYEAWHSSAIAPRPYVAVPINAFTSKVDQMTAGSKAFHWATLLPWLDGVWTLGVIGLSIRSFGGWLWLQRIRRTAIEEAPELIQTCFQQICVKVGLARYPRLRISRIVSGPMTVGALRTLVLLPASALLALSPEQLEAIFAHELAHIRRADYFWNLVQTLAETLFFFHPAIWWLGKRLREQRELCCDDIAVEMCSDPLIYATALFRLESQRAAGLNLAMALDGHQTAMSFRSRILRILGEAAPQSRIAELRPFSVVAVVVSLFLFLSPLPRTIGTAAAQSHPLKQMLAIRSEITLATQHLSLHPESARPTPIGLTEQRLENRTSQPIDKSVSNTVDYQTQMKAAGYDVEEGQYTAMQKAAITPAYAKEMSGLGFGKPSVGTLLELRKQNISQEDLTTLHAAGLDPRGFDQLISWKLFHIDTEFISGMKAAGFDAIPPRALLTLRAVGVTPEYAKDMKAHDPNLTIRDLILSRAQYTNHDASSLAPSHSDQPPAFIATPSSQPPPHITRGSEQDQALQGPGPPPHLQ
jgi:beta-lactamase regulating signal transducer with metallopeptidase domain